MLTMQGLHPAFDRYKLPYIAERTGYSVQYLRDVRAGRAPFTEKLRRVLDLTFPECIAEVPA